MALIDRLLARLRPAGVERVVYAPEAARASIAGKTVAELYAEQPHLRTVVDFIAQNVAQLTPKCYTQDAGGDKLRDTDGVLPLLLKEPNPDMTTYDLIYSLVSDWCLYGRVVWLVGESIDSASGWEVRPIPPPWITQWEGGNGFSYSEVWFQDFETGGGIVKVPTSDCVIFTSYDPASPARALSPVESLRNTLAEQVEAAAYRRSVWDNATRISGYVSRPQGVEWSEGAAKRFRDDMRENWSRNGAKAGGTPVLEDGMEYHPVTFSAREAEWASGVQLSREDCAAAYHVNPAMIWNASGQTYASAKENARALYSDTLMPILTMVQQRLTKRLAPMVGAPAGEFVEFDIRAKMQGAFEDQAASIQTAVGGPWMTREEARRMMNMPAEPDGELIVPLNVLVGGLASPTDTAPKAVEYVGEPSHSKSAPLQHKARPTDDEKESIRRVLEGFFARQRKSVLSSIGAAKGKSAGDAPSWWNPERWDAELAEDLAEALLANATAAAKRALESLGLDPEAYDEPHTRNYLAAWAKSRAAGINATTLKHLESALSGELEEDAEGSTPEGVFDIAETSRAESLGLTISTAVASWGALEACRQCAPGGVMKRWDAHQSKDPRSSHRRLDGQTVPMDGKFSNGADYPGDSINLPAQETANCHCDMTVIIP